MGQGLACYRTRRSHAGRTPGEKSVNCLKANIRPMNAAPLSPEQAWQAAVGQLRLEIPKAAFDTWVRDARLISHANGQFVIGVANSYGRDWLTERLSKSLENALTGILNHPQAVRFVVQETPLESELDQAELAPERAWAEAQGILARLTSPADFESWIAPARYQGFTGDRVTIAAPDQAAQIWLNDHLRTRARDLLSGLLGRPVSVSFTTSSGDGEPAPDDPTRDQPAPGKSPDPAHDVKMLIEVAREDLRAAYTRPDQVHVMPAYLLRWLPYANPGHFLTLLAFRQAMYCDRSGAPTENAPFSASIRSIAQIIGANKDTVLAHRDSWLLRWFLRHLPNDQYTFHPETGQVRRQADRYTFLATTPLTPGDQDALQNWLLENGIQTDPVAALKSALARPPREILPYPAPQPNALLKQRPPSDQNRNFNHLVLALCPPELPKETLAEVLDLAGQLREHLIGADKLAFISLYFLRHWAPLLGNGAACTVIACRQRAYANQATGEVREVFKLAGGLAGLGALTGLGASTLRKLLPLPEQPARGARAGRKRGHSPAGAAPDPQRAARRLERRQLVSQIVYRTRKAGQDDLLVWARKADPLTPAHQADYEAANTWIAWFLARFPAGFAAAQVDAFLTVLRAAGVFGGEQLPANPETWAIGENLDDEVGGFSDNRVSEKPDKGIGGFSPKEIGEKLDNLIGDNADMGVGEESTIGQAENWAETGQLKYQKIQYLSPEILRNILIPLSNTIPTPSSHAETAATWPVQEGEGWAEILPPEEIKAVTNNHGNIDLHEVVSYWLHVYSPQGEGIKLPREYVRSRLGSGAYSPTHLRLAQLGPKGLGDLLRNTRIEEFTGRMLVDADLAGSKEWLRVMKGTKEQERLFELAERLGLRVYAPAGQQQGPGDATRR